MEKVSRVMVVAVMLMAACSPSPALSPVELTEMHHCGYGFHVGTPDQSAALLVTFEDFESAHRGEVPETSELAGGAWNAEVRLGSDLFANWCDDVLEPGEPTPDVSETWPIVSGTITVLSLPSPGECGPAEATLEAMEAKTLDGRLVEVGGLQAQNEFWGCFAG